ncbi:MAG: AhpC/TSA family protein [Deltaproteobacteria bacterium]|nr:AhpC/TSA family protein [Deltaproteobacteria bacterium]
MRHIEKTLDAYDVKVAVVTFEAGFLARAYVQETGLQWPLLVDTDRTLYHAYDMLNASFWDVWGPKTLWAYAKELLGGAKLVKSDGDISQRGGDVLIDPESIVRLHHVGDGPADRPPVAKLLEVIEVIEASGFTPVAAAASSGAARS